MNTKLCRTCGHAGEDYIDIFKTDGLKHKIETCLPLIIDLHSLLPDSICKKCHNKIESFYVFTKNCLQNIIILESKLDIEQSCLKSQRRKDKSCLASISLSKECKSVQTEDISFNESHSISSLSSQNFCYRDDSDEVNHRSERGNKHKRKGEHIESTWTKIRRSNSGNRRKCNQDDEFMDGFNLHDASMEKKDLPDLVNINDLIKTEPLDESPDKTPSLHPTFICPNCPAIFSNKNDLFLHLQLNHSDESVFLCGVCLYQVDTRSKLKDHVEKCMLKSPVSTKFYCEVCYFGEDNFKVLENHVLFHKFLIEACQKEVRNFDPEDYIAINSNLNKVHSSPVKYFTCLECNRSDFDTFSKFSAHRRSDHSIYHCDLCSKFYEHKSLLWKHVTQKHKNHPCVTCQICFKTNSSKYRLAQHFRKRHNNFLENDNFVDPVDKDHDVQEDFEEGHTDCDSNSLKTFSEHESSNSLDKKIAAIETHVSSDVYDNIKDEGVLKCLKCSKTFTKQALLDSHQENCSLQKGSLTKCKTCAKVFRDRKRLARHIINHHSDYNCEICKEQFQSKCDIVSHIRFEHPSSHLECSVCENILRCQKDLLGHLGNHENSYVCQFCADTLDSKMKLKMHILSMHHQLLSLSCSFCLKRFENQKILRDHVTCVHKHQLNPLTSCPVCGNHYGSKRKTLDHVKKSHGSTFKVCRICLELFDSETQLEDHVKLVHIKHSVPNNVQSKTSTKPCDLLKSEESNSNCDAITIGMDYLNSASEYTDSEEYDDHRSVDLNEKQRHLDQQLSNSNEEKMILLEKRLVAKETRDIIDESSKNKNHLYKALKQSDGLKSSKDKPKDKIIQSPDSTKFSTNNFKRTVYVESNDPAWCQICHKSFPAKKHLWQHFIRCHKKDSATVCGICLKINTDYETLQKHLRSTHMDLLDGSKFICRICGRYHNANTKLQHHMAIHVNFDWNLLDAFPPLKSFSLNSKLSNMKQEDNHNSDYSQVYGNSETLSTLSQQNQENNQMGSDTDEEDTRDNEVKNFQNQPENYKKNIRNFLRPKAEELDSAIESITSSLKQEIIDLTDDLSDSDQIVHSQNETEIESAVGSIL
ncbi:zinc finger protein 808-like isoform X2 [Sitophilus oryzae]|uniref:Zinc finger protein 808-like isoform X2 n=1 Tax=Sitophilus oryzae TaxID=7048 RepID=A0A6J2YJY8_SITOR|nr:zinc finger protein 808-like isoform X2 [Sitophilus oryzae]